MKNFIRAHFLIGTVFFVLFLLTGAYMANSFPALYHGREEVRMMYRATHIYILMSALINLMAGNFLLQTTQLNLPRLRKIASLLILVTPILFCVAFVIEPPAYLIDRPVTFWAVISLVVGVMLHTVLNIKFAQRNP